MTRGLLNVWELDALNAMELQRARRLLAGVLRVRRVECNRASACKEAACWQPLQVPHATSLNSLPQRDFP